MSTIDDVILCEVCMTYKLLNAFDQGRSRCLDCCLPKPKSVASRPVAQDEKAYQREYYQKNRGRLRQKQNEYYYANRDKYRGYCTKYRTANRQKITDRQRAQRAANPERSRAKNQAWRAANPERHRANVRASKRRNPDSIRAAKQRRRARLQGNGGSYSAAAWRMMCEHFGNVCLCCGGLGPLTVDHVIPIVAGGPNSIENLQPLCKPCNVLKKARTIDYRDPALLAALLAVLDKGGS